MEFEILDKTISLVARRCSGKSYLIRYLVNLHKDKFDKIFILCPTERINRFYNSITDEHSIFDEFDEDWVEMLIERLTRENANKSKDERKHCLLIMDDIAADNNFHHCKSIKKMYARGRHLGLTIFQTVQSLTMLSPLQRNNSDYLLVGQLNNASLNCLADEFLAGNINKQEFIQLYNRCTTDYNFLVINCNSIKDTSDLNQIYGIIKTPESDMN